MSATSATSAAAASSAAVDGDRKFYETAVREASMDALFSPLSLGEKIDIRLKPRFNTACWSFQPPHKVFIGLQILDKAKKTATRFYRAKYIRSHVRHEMAHAHYTQRDLRKVQRELAEFQCPFGLFNLFEDGRIEERYRIEAKYRFDWLDGEDLGFTLQPGGLLFQLIQAEGDVARVEKFNRTCDIKAPAAGDHAALAAMVPMAMLTTVAAEGQDPTASPFDFTDTSSLRVRALELLPRVVEYYKRIIDAKSSEALYPVLKDWMGEFGTPPSSPGRGNEGQGEGGQADLELSLDLQSSPKDAKEFESDTTMVVLGASPDDDPVEGNGKDPKADPQDLNLVSSKGRVLTSRSTPVDEAKAQKLAERFMKFFEQKSRVVATQTPQRRVSARHYALDRAPYRKRELMGKGRRKIVYIMDCSGSMSSFMQEGKLILRALCILTEKGYVEGHVILSAVNAAPNHEVWKLPMPSPKLACIQGYAGAEGLEYAMTDNMALLADADYVFAYTDANICDKPIKKAKFHARGIFTYGLYSGEGEGVVARIQEYFDKAIVRSTAEGIVDMMLTQR